MNTSNKVCDLGHNMWVYQNSEVQHNLPTRNYLCQFFTCTKTKNNVCAVNSNQLHLRKHFKNRHFTSHHFDMFSCFKSKNILFKFTKTDKNKKISKIMFPVEKREHKWWVSECPTFCSSGCNEAEHQGGDEEEDGQEKRRESRGQHHKEGNHVSNVYITQYS